jgi:putative acetyltransferase
MVELRKESSRDYAAVRRLNELAFERTTEAALIDALRGASSPQLSLVAVEDEQVVGHVFFGPVSIVSEGEESTAIALGVMAVMPGWQKKGIGSQLVRYGLKECERLGQHVVVVIGHPGFYPRFGFVPGRSKGLRCEYDDADEAFMVAELTPGALRGRKGLVKYPPEFAEA